MLFGLFWGDFSLLILVPGLIFTLIAEAGVKSTAKRYGKIPLRPGMTGAAVARRILDSNGLGDVSVGYIRGALNDHYDPRDRALYLSDTTYEVNSITAVGVAAHEAGHALQHGKGYLPLRFRMAIVPVCNWGSRLAMPLFFVGLLLSSYFYYEGSMLGDYLMFAGILAFSLSVFFELVTLPVEFDASRRALRCLKGSGTMTKEELAGARKVLSAAALTYVAALAVGLLSLLRLLLIAGGRRRR